ncbi:MAG: hypothetical protein AAB964_01665, partial [Patescibacteria group bacterium]
MLSSAPFIISKRRKPRLPRVLGAAAIVALVIAAWYARAPLSGLLWQAGAPLVAARNALGETDSSRLRAEVARL